MKCQNYSPKGLCTFLYAYIYVRITVIMFVVDVHLYNVFIFISEPERPGHHTETYRYSKKSGL